MEIAISLEEGQEVVASNISDVEFDELRDWFCYTKPIGQGVNVIARPTPKGEPVFHIRAAGTAPGCAGDASA